MEAVCGSGCGRRVPTSITRHTLATVHIAALGLHIQHSCAWCTYTYKSTHSLTCLRTPGGMACSSSPSLLGLGPAGLELATARLHTAPAARHPPPPCCARPPTADSCKKINSLTSGRNIDSERYCRVVRDSKNTLLATAQADSAETFTVRQRAARSILP